MEAAEAAGIDFSAARAAEAAAAMVAGAAEGSYPAVRRTDTAADYMLPSRSMTNMPPARSMTSYGPGTGAGAGLAAAGAGVGLPSPLTVPSLLATRTNGGGIQPGDLDGVAAPAPALTRSMTGAYDYNAEVGLSNRTPTLFRESRFSAHSASTEGEEADGGAAPAAPSVRRTATEHHGPPSSSARDLESLKEEVRSNLRQLLYALQAEIERPHIFRSHDEMAAQDQRYDELDEQIEATLRLLTALN
jgi:hypothetical protein